MPARRPREWWAATRAGSIAAAAGFLALAAGATLLAVSEPILVGGTDLGDFAAVVLAPFVAAAAVWRLAVWQDGVDRRHSMTGDD